MAHPPDLSSAELSFRHQSLTPCQILKEMVQWLPKIALQSRLCHGPVNGLCIYGGGEVPHIFLTAVFSQKKCWVEKILFSIRLTYYYLGSTRKKIKFGTGNIVYLAILSAVFDPPPINPADV